MPMPLHPSPSPRGEVQPTNRMVAQRRQIEQRRRQLQTRMPAHFCHHCTAVVYEEDAHCLECGEARPEGGWLQLGDSMDPWLGRVLTGRYLLTKCIGQGASASVYRAESLAISRQFAVKIIHPANASKGPTPEQIAARLEREIEALGRLRNPHVVRFYDVIELPLHHIGVVMDFVEGETLESLVEREGPLSLGRAIALLRQIANGLYEAHLAQMTHRDLKPENLMVERMPAGDEFVHILDFGIVYVDGSVNMTQGFIGTPLYASPEQALGEAVDHRSDIYSLGAIFFFMLTGRPPFLGTNVMQVLRQHVESKPPALAELRRDLQIPPELEMLVRHMLAKHAERRPQSLSEIIQAVDLIAQNNFERSPSPLVSAAHLERPTSRSQPLEDMKETVRSDVSLAEQGAKPSAPSAAAIITPSSRARAVQEGLGMISTSSSTLNEPTHAGLPGLSRVELPKKATIGCATGSRQLLFAYTMNDQLYVHKLRQGPEAQRFTLPQLDVSSIALSEGFALLGHQNGAINRVSFKDGASTSLFQSVFPTPVVGVAIGPEQKLLLAAMESGRVYISQANKDERDWVRVRSSSKLTALKLSPRADLYAVAREDGLIEVSRMAEPKQVRLTLDVGQRVLRMTFSEDSYLLGAMLADGTLALYQVINGKRVFTMPIPKKVELLDVFFSSETHSLLGYLREKNHLLVEDLQQLS